MRESEAISSLPSPSKCGASAENETVRSPSASASSAAVKRARSTRTASRIPDTTASSRRTKLRTKSGAPISNSTRATLASPNRLICEIRRVEAARLSSAAIRAATSLSTPSRKPASES